MTTATTEALQWESLSRARQGQSMSNFATIIRGFTAKGILAEDIRPRENVFTYNAWKALGRCVRKGEHGVHVVTYVPIRDKAEQAEQLSELASDGQAAKNPKSHCRPWSAVVFHISQTDPITA